MSTPMRVNVFGHRIKTPRAIKATFAVTFWLDGSGDQKTVTGFTRDGAWKAAVARKTGERASISNEMTGEQGWLFGVQS